MAIPKKLLAEHKRELAYIGYVAAQNALRKLGQRDFLTKGQAKQIREAIMIGVDNTLYENTTD